jgi:hypothetical protein
MMQVTVFMAGFMARVKALVKGVRRRRAKPGQSIQWIDCSVERPRRKRRAGRGGKALKPGDIENQS